jgi:hypothetical protein
MSMCLGLVDGKSYYLTTDEQGDQTVFHFKKKKWTAKHGNGYEEKVERIKRLITEAMHDFERAEAFNKEQACIISAIATSMFKERRLDFDYVSRGIGFNISSKKIGVSFATNDEAKILISVKTPSWTKNTSLSSKAVELLEQAFKENG